MCVCMLSPFSSVQLFMTPWTAAHQAPLSMGFSRKEYWSRLALPSSRGSSQPRDWTWVSCIKGRFFTIWATKEARTQLLTPRALEPVLHKRSPHAAQPEKACTAQQGPSAAKMKERGWTRAQACPALPSKTSHLNQNAGNYQWKVKVCVYLLLPWCSAPRG